MCTSNISTNRKRSFSPLLEFAADNDVEGFRQFMGNDTISAVVGTGLWYCRRFGSEKMVLDYRTPLMVAAQYGSIDVLILIISLPGIDVNFSSGRDKTTPLHCAVSGGSVNSLDAVMLLIRAGADPNSTDINGHRSIDVVMAPRDLKLAIKEILTKDTSSDQFDMMAKAGSFKPELRKLVDQTCSSKKEYPNDPTLPDIKNSVFGTDEFRMYFLKVWPCSRAYPHDWTECPFVHPGENARRRDPRKYHYSSIPCPDHRKGACKKGDLCEYSHGIFEYWLHPAQYRTRLCKDGPSCPRRVCFFAHTSQELRTSPFSQITSGNIQPNQLRNYPNGLRDIVLSQFQDSQSLLAPMTMDVFAPKKVDQIYHNESLLHQLLKNKIAMKPLYINSTVNKEPEPDLSWIDTMLNEEHTETADNFSPNEPSYLYDRALLRDDLERAWSGCSWLKTI